MEAKGQSVLAMEFEVEAENREVFGLAPEVQSELESGPGLKSGMGLGIYVGLGLALGMESVSGVEGKLVLKPTLGGWSGFPSAT